MVKLLCPGRSCNVFKRGTLHSQSAGKRVAQIMPMKVLEVSSATVSSNQCLVFSSGSPVLLDRNTRPARHCARRPFSKPRAQHHLAARARLHRSSCAECSTAAISSLPCPKSGRIGFPFANRCQIDLRQMKRSGCTVLRKRFSSSTVRNRTRLLCSVRCGTDRAWFVAALRLRIADESIG